MNISAAILRSSLPSSSGISALSAALIPNNLSFDEFVNLYDDFASTASIPGLAYTTQPPESRNAIAADDFGVGGDGGEDDYNLYDAVDWPGEGTDTSEGNGFLPLEPKEDSYYLQFGDLTSIHLSVGGNERCWVDLHRRKVKAVAAEMYYLICRVRTESGSVVASKIILRYAVTDKCGNLMGYVSSGRVTPRFTGWKPNDFGIGPGIPAAAAATSVYLLF
jgi:hypothetical protein